MSDAELLESITKVAREAGDLILQVYATDFAVRGKDDASPVTEADERAEALILRGLASLAPEIPVVAEESVAAGRVPDIAGPSGRFWLVDPLDGTKEFISRNGEFTVNIALIEAHRPVLGVVHIPVTDTTYSGIPGVGAWRAANDRPRAPISVRRAVRPPLRVVGSRSHGVALDSMLAALGPCELKPAGSSIKLCLIADGSADLYPRLGPTSEWDIAAGQAVVEAAGGQVVRIADGRALQYNTRAQLLNPDFLAYGDPDIYRRWPRG